MTSHIFQNLRVLCTTHTGFLVWGAVDILAGPLLMLLVESAPEDQAGQWLIYGLIGWAVVVLVQLAWGAWISTFRSTS